jgi:diguanylate cyclase (GGDEF)-like protein
MTGVPMLALHRVRIATLIALAIGICVLYAMLGVAKPAAELHWLDVAGEGGTALLCATCLVLILASRPPGRVTTLLALGLSALTLGAWSDCLDEFFRVPEIYSWDSWLEAGFTLGGGLVLTFGLHHYRLEQIALNEHLYKRERLFREHRSFDRVTQVANADYLRGQLAIEAARAPDDAASLVLLDLDDFHLVNRQHGTPEGDRLLQAVTQLLLLNVRTDDLICRYAADRFAVLMPRTQLAKAQHRAEQLRRMVELRRFSPSPAQPTFPSVDCWTGAGSWPQTWRMCRPGSVRSSCCACCRTPRACSPRPIPASCWANRCCPALLAP